MAIFTVLQFVLTAVIGLGFYLFATGRFTQKQVDGQEATAADLTRLQATMAVESQRVDARIAGEHDERKRLVEVINTQIGALQIEQSGQRERMRGLEDAMKEVRRKVFNGGAAST